MKTNTPTVSRPINKKKTPKLEDSLKQLRIFANKNGWRFGQALSNLLAINDIGDSNLFYLSDERLICIIDDYVK